METSLCLPCISSTVSSPSSEDEKDKLHMAGLGEKVIGFSALNVDAGSFLFLTRCQLMLVRVTVCHDVNISVFLMASHKCIFR